MPETLLELTRPCLPNLTPKTKPRWIAFSRRYVAALRKQLKKGKPASLASVRGLGRQAAAAGLQTLDLANLHERTLVTNILPLCPAGRRAAFIKQAGKFFTAVITQIATTHRTEQENAIHKTFIQTLSQRTVELAASNLGLRQEVIQRKAGEIALKKSERHYAKLFEQSSRLQEELRELSRQVLSAQENERKKISHELHDVIGQTLTGINIQLATLKKEAGLGVKSIDRNIARTQRLVERSVNIVHRFARRLRPPALDDLGLIPALHSFMKNFTERTGIRASLIAFAAVERLDTMKRTVLYRVAQEALTNVTRHAHASRVEVCIQKRTHRVCMKIKDDGQSFDVQRILNANRGKRLGLLGMRERVEMVGGSFDVESAPGIGTTIVARIPLGKIGARKTRKNRHKNP